MTAAVEGEAVRVADEEFGDIGWLIGLAAARQPNPVPFRGVAGRAVGEVNDEIAEVADGIEQMMTVRDQMAGLGLANLGHPPGTDRFRGIRDRQRPTAATTSANRASAPRAVGLRSFGGWAVRHRTAADGPATAARPATVRTKRCDAPCIATRTSPRAASPENWWRSTVGAESRSSTAPICRSRAYCWSVSSGQVPVIPLSWMALVAVAVSDLRIGARGRVARSQACVSFVRGTDVILAHSRLFATSSPLGVTDLRSSSCWYGCRCWRVDDGGLWVGVQAVRLP